MPSPTRPTRRYGVPASYMANTPFVGGGVQWGATARAVCGGRTSCKAERWNATRRASVYRGVMRMGVYVLYIRTYVACQH